MTEIKLPELGENIESAEVSRLLVAEGDDVQAGQNVLELESEKACFPLTWTSGGRIAKIHVKAGDTVSIGQTLMDIEASEGAQAKQKTEADGKPKKIAKDKKATDAPHKREEPDEDEAREE